MRSAKRLLVAASAFFCMCVALAQAPFVKITSPKSGIVVRPGEILTVVVDATPGVFKGVIVTPFTAGGSVSGPPYRVLLEVPADIMPGVYPVGAIGVPPSGLKGKTDNDKDLVRDTIDLDVERSDSPKILTAELSNPYDRTVEGFHKVGETRWLSIIGVFADGTKVELRSSKLTSYMCAPTSVVTVDGEGVVTAIGQGPARITVKNGSATMVVPVSVP